MNILLCSGIGGGLSFEGGQTGHGLVQTDAIRFSFSVNLYLFLVKLVPT